MNGLNKNLIDLLDYLEQVEKLKVKPAYVPPSQPFVAYQAELKGLVGIEFTLQSDEDVWLRCARLQEHAPPELPAELRDWVTLAKSPERQPLPRDERVVVDKKGQESTVYWKNHPELHPVLNRYIAQPWQAWSEAEKPRRRSIAIYNKLFSLQQVLEAEGSESQLELIWGIGVAVWKKDGHPVYRYPLLLQPCELILNRKTFDLDIRPRPVDARMDLDAYTQMEISGVTALEAYWRAQSESSASRLNPFDGSTYEEVLNTAVGLLDAGGTFKDLANVPEVPVPTDKLCITNTWVLFARKRTGDVIVEDVRRLKKALIDGTSTTSVAGCFVQKGSDEVQEKEVCTFRGLGSSSNPKGAKELYFPMPYNDEQVSVVSKLETSDGVVVQGPPGTGKTHTIANVICHYLAQGKRVLVTAKGETPLAVLQEKLPESVRPLCVALLSDERDGMKQFELSIQTIASKVSEFSPSDAARKIENAEGQLQLLHAKIHHLDSQITEQAGKHLCQYFFQGKDCTAEDIAKYVMKNVDEYGWFDDHLAASAMEESPFDEDQILALRHARIKVGDKLPYVGCKLPVPDAFPAWDEMLALHRDLQRARQIEANLQSGRVLAVKDSSTQVSAKAQALETFLQERLELKLRVRTHKQPWTEMLSKRVRDIEGMDPVLAGLVAACEGVRKLDAQRREFMRLAIQIPQNAELHEEFAAALDRLTMGKSAFVLPVGKADARKLLQGVTALGLAPQTSDDWKNVQMVLEWRLQVRQLHARWIAFSDDLGIPAPGGDPEECFKLLAQWEKHIADVLKYVREYDAHTASRVTEVFGNEVANHIHEKGEPHLAEVALGVRVHLEKRQLASTLNRLQDLHKKIDGMSGKVVDGMKDFLMRALGTSKMTEPLMRETWFHLLSELRRVNSISGALDSIDRMSALIEGKGAKRWAQRIRSVPATKEGDPVIPPNWREAWNWRRAQLFLEEIDKHHAIRELFSTRHQLTRQLSKTYQTLVSEKTWLSVFNNSPESVRQALQTYLNAVQAMGAGTGIRAIRHRRSAREAMERAYASVPCWVMPQWRISEAIPAEIGLFDLVVIDEASQSDMWALPALLRGKKVLVVGDHKQVSPSAVGTAEEKILELSRRYLNHQPHGTEMTMDESIYDLARVVFAGNSVMLKEHFRSVPAIIEFSNREFYQGEIRPLRLPKSHERLDPPLVDVYVKGGYREGDINHAEALAIVQEIQDVIKDERMAKRSIGVVTLMGMKQAAHISNLINKRIAVHEIVERGVVVGAPPAFQGRERDIMMISMVLGADDSATPNRLDMQQRFNVAMSRARDRMYLFRSIQEGTFSENTLNARVIHHFQQPFKQDVRKVTALRERCESGFELEMFDELVRRGYRVEPQVPCGGYRIDFVVEGKESRRLAVECDGDRYHGPAQWSDDMARQRVLERAGWTFWRCFASSFVRRRKEVLQELFSTLESMGIEPLGSESVDNSVWVHFKEVDPLALDKADPSVSIDTEADEVAA